MTRQELSHWEHIREGHIDQLLIYSVVDDMTLRLALVKGTIFPRNIAKFLSLCEKWTEQNT